MGEQKRVVATRSGKAWAPMPQLGKPTEGTLDRMRIPRKRGRPRQCPAWLVADNAYNCDRFRRRYKKWGEH